MTVNYIDKNQAKPSWLNFQTVPPPFYSYAKLLWSPPVKKSKPCEILAALLHYAWQGISLEEAEPIFQPHFIQHQPSVLIMVPQRNVETSQQIMPNGIVTYR